MSTEQVISPLPVADLASVVPTETPAETPAVPAAAASEEVKGTVVVGEKHPREEEAMSAEETLVDEVNGAARDKNPVDEAVKEEKVGGDRKKRKVSGETKVAAAEGEKELVVKELSDASVAPANGEHLEHSNGHKVVPTTENGAETIPLLEAPLPAQPLEEVAPIKSIKNGTPSPATTTGKDTTAAEAAAFDKLVNAADEAAAFVTLLEAQPPQMPVKKVHDGPAAAVEVAPIQ